MRIQITRTTVKPMVFASGDTSWGVQDTDGQWYTLFQERKPEKGEVIEADVKVVEKGGKTFRNAYPKPSPVQVEKAKEVLKPVVTATKLYPPPEPVMTGTIPEAAKSDHKLEPVKPNDSKVRTTPYTHPLEDYEKLINRGFEIAGLNGVTDDAARVSLVATLCIAFGDGKLSIDDLPMDTMDAPLPEELQTGEDWGDRDWTDGPPPVAEVAKMADEAAEMEAAKARMDKFVKTAPAVDNTDYKTQLGAAIKTYCFNNKLDFKTNKFEVLWRCAETRNLESLSQAEAKIAIEQLKVMP